MVRIVALLLIAGSLFCPALGLAQSGQGSSAKRDRPEDKEPDKFDWLVLGTDVGFRSLRITRIDFDDSEDVPKFLPSTSYGVAPAVSLGVRLWFVSLSARSELAFFHGPEGVE